LQKEKEDSQKLKELRDLAVVTFFMLNALFVLVILLLEFNKDQLYVKWPFGVTVNIRVDEISGEVCIMYVCMYVCIFLLLLFYFKHVPLSMQNYML
jgi:hypothetical protein